MRSLTEIEATPMPTSASVPPLLLISPPPSAGTGGGGVGSAPRFASRARDSFSTQGNTPPSPTERRGARPHAERGAVRARLNEEREREITGGPKKRQQKGKAVEWRKKTIRLWKSGSRVLFPPFFKEKKTVLLGDPSIAFLKNNPPSVCPINFSLAINIT